MRGTAGGRQRHAASAAPGCARGLLPARPRSGARRDTVGEDTEQRKGRRQPQGQRLRTEGGSERCSGLPRAELPSAARCAPGIRLEQKGQPRIACRAGR